MQGVDLLDVGNIDHLTWLLAKLCQEARVCLHDPETNPIEIHGAWYHVETGLVVKDRQGRLYRLEVTAHRTS